MIDKAIIIEQICKTLLSSSKDGALNFINEKYKFDYKVAKNRAYSERQKIQVFLRDGFIDRYTGDKLVNPGILKALSVHFPEDFPYHLHWKMEKTHIAYWELTPTLDHIVPIARGGEDAFENWVTTSQLHNSIKSHWTLEQMGWKLFEPGNLSDWNGLTKLFIELVEKDGTLLEDNYVKRWYKFSKEML